MSSSEMFVGVDGCKSGWLAAVWTPAERSLDWIGFPTLAAVLKAFPECTIGIDIPLGLSDRGDRPCDKAARKLLGWPRSSSVFAPPIPSVLGYDDYPAANAASKEAIGKGISKQAHALFPKMLQANEAVRPDMQHRVFELHPEVSFRGLAGESLIVPKRTAEGFDRRRHLLNDALALRVPIPVRSAVARMVRQCGAMPDDALDAAVAAWSAHRVATGTEVRLRGDAIH